VRQWKNHGERERKLEADCDRFCSRLELRRADERDGHGRWLLRGPWTWAEVVTLSNGICVGGDIETVVFQGGSDRQKPRGLVYWMATTSYGYAAEKARAGNTGDYGWDEDCAAFDVCWHRRQRDLEKEQARNIYNAIRDGRHFFVDAICEADDGDLGELYDMGEVIPAGVFMATAVLRRLAWLFKAHELRAVSRAWFGRAA
jgi:hypothetical protein